MRGIMLTVVFALVCSISPAMDKNDIRNMSKAGVDPAVIVKLAKDFKITLSESEAAIFIKDGVPETVVSILTVKDAPAVAVSSTAVGPENLIIANVGQLPFHVSVNITDQEIVFSHTLGKYFIPVNNQLVLSVPNREYRAYWHSYDDILEAKVKRGEVTTVSIEARNDIIYGYVYRDGEEQDSGYLWRRLSTYSPVVVVEPSLPPVYVVREPVYIYRQSPPRSTFFFDFDFGGHDRGHGRHDSHRDHHR